MDSDVLEPVALEEISELVKIFEKDHQKFYPLKQYIEILSEYKKAKVEVPNQTLYRYGDVENGVYVVESEYSAAGVLFGGRPKMYYYFIFTASDDLSELKHALASTSRIPWTFKGFVFEVVLDRFAPVVNEVAKTKGLVLGMEETYMMWLPKPVCCSTPPEDMYLAKLDSSHVAEVNNNWPHKNHGSEVYLGYQISNYFSLGLFRKTDKKLVSSVLSFQSGGMFVLYTEPEFRGKGYADIIVRNMSFELHRKRRIPFVTVLCNNIPSQSLFSKIGFQHLTKAYYLINV